MPCPVDTFFVAYSVGNLNIFKDLGTRASSSSINNCTNVIIEGCLQTNLEGGTRIVSEKLHIWRDLKIVSLRKPYV